MTHKQMMTWSHRLQSLRCCRTVAAKGLPKFGDFIAEACSLVIGLCVLCANIRIGIQTGRELASWKGPRRQAAESVVWEPRADRIIY